MQSRRCEPARFLDARGPSISVRDWNPRRILSSSFLVFPSSPQPSCGSVVYSYEEEEEEGEADRQIAAFHDQGPKISSRASCSRKREGRRGEYRVERRGFYDRRVIYRSFEYRTSNWIYSYTESVSRDNSLVSTKY